MLELVEALIYAPFYIAVLFVPWYFSMDIQNASRVLWNACGNLRGKVSHAKIKRRASDSDFELVHDGEDNSIPCTPDGKDNWSLTSSFRPEHASADDLRLLTILAFSLRTSSWQGLEVGQHLAGAHKSLFVYFEVREIQPLWWISSLHCDNGLQATAS